MKMQSLLLILHTTFIAKSTVPCYNIIAHRRWDLLGLACVLSLVCQGTLDNSPQKLKNY
jgi:hypothetical protein